jgi:hypothetical protein
MKVTRLESTILIDRSIGDREIWRLKSGCCAV